VARHAIPPAPTRDLDDEHEIAELVRRFYADVTQDAVLGPVFNDVARVDWSEHLPKLEAFWCRALLGREGYAGNPFAAHRRVHEQQPFTAAHFVRWLELFHETVDLGWAGANAGRAKALAENVARVHSRQLTGEAVALEPPTAVAPAGAREVPAGRSAAAGRHVA
jgi:hemoglobin